MIFCEKILAKIKISLHRSVEKLRSHKRYFCLFVCLGAFISEIELPRIPTYLLKRSSKQIAYRLLDLNKDDKLVKFIQLGLLSKASLNELLLSSREKNNASISSYILEELDKFSQSTFRL